MMICLLFNVCSSGQDNPEDLHYKLYKADLGVLQKKINKTKGEPSKRKYCSLLDTTSTNKPCQSAIDIVI